MKLIKLVGAALAMGAVALVVSACQKKDETPGPAESMGKQIDSAVKTAGDQAADAADKAKVEAKELAEKAGEKLQTAGQKIQDAAQDAKK